MATSDKILVTGASGHLGRLVVQHLLDTEKVPAQQIIATSRKVEALADLKARGVDVRMADFAQPDSLVAAFTGAQRALLISTDEIGKRLESHKRAIDAAQAAGVAYMVYTSMPKPQDSLVSFAPEHLGTEQLLQTSPMQVTILRNSWYFENVLLSAGQWLATGQAHSAAGDGKLSHIAREDLARAAAAALVAEPAGKKILTLTGSEAFTIAEITNLVGAAAGKAIEVIPVSTADVVAGVVQAGMPEPVGEMFASFDANIQAGLFAEITDDFVELTGREPMRFADWLVVNKAAFAG
ncbi:MAG: NAD(P)-dependent oxidoreductase [Burkholderiaceae bacterium]|nr:NAD(P)-dependent oxidoreductase [Burkholderiaceae bacterium]